LLQAFHGKRAGGIETSAHIPLLNLFDDRATPWTIHNSHAGPADAIRNQNVICAAALHVVVSR
jgi:hypothetical protein